MISTVLALSMLPWASASTSSWQATPESFAQWKSLHGKTYAGPDEEARRFSAWAANLAVVEAHNSAGGSTFTLGMNKLADLTNDEYRARYLNLRPSGRSQASATYKAIGKDIPSDWTWMDKGIVTPVKDQGNCGSCWSFSAVAAMEGAFNWANQAKGMPSQCTTKCGPNATHCCSFSEQEVADCTLHGKDNCNAGGEMHDGIMQIVSQNGTINTEKQYPYTSGDSGHLSKCQPLPDPVSTGVSGYTNVTHGDESALAEAVATHPIISIGIDASENKFQLYSGGIYSNPKCHNTMDKLDHGVTLIGYGSGNPKPPSPNPGKNCLVDYTYKAQCEAHSDICHWCASGFCEPIGQGCPTRDYMAAPGGDFWMVKNSWGVDWGMNGYIAMSRNADNQCGVATDAIFANIAAAEEL